MSRRNKLTLSKIKKIFKEVFKEIGDFFKNILKKIKALPTKVKMIIVVWIIILIIIITLITMTSNNTKTLSTYQKYEQTINEAALKYVENNSYYGTRDKKLKVDLEELKDAKLITDSNIPDNSCKGYSLTYYDDETETFNSKTYINCSKYTSSDYYDFK